jgi:RimJ/RimL family protein N-acetyltransferase
MIAPTLHTQNLTLRMPVLADFEPHAEFASSDRSIWEGGPMNRHSAWRVFASEVGQWPLLGYGPFSVDDTATGAHVGEVGIYHPSDYPEPELGWFVVPTAEGRGIAAESALRVMHWARFTFGWDRLVNYIDPMNARSIALGLRLGGEIDKTLKGPDETDVVIRHDLRGLV